MALDGYDVRGFQVGGLLRRGSAVVWRSRRKGRGADFVWRALDVGWDINYRANLLLRHPLTAASLHAVCNRNTGRNRVWLANRHLPTILVPIYLATWIAYTIRQRPPLSGLRSWWAGSFEGTECPAYHDNRCGGGPYGA
ncbi:MULTISPECIES: hypothetical protein [unclassified Streptomyces]|uniref:hypothetical protein n=1 Tax=unclassified Streptomyces TaxID=2593676 RepID=UPI002E282D1D|nr:hypothetical protein [Streptomyces sp. NBC_00273]